MRVVHIITSLQTGGAETSLVKLLSHLNRDRVSSTVVALQAGPLAKSIERMGIPVYQIGMGSVFTSVFRVPKLIQLTRRLKPDILQGWMIHGNLAAELSAVFSAAPARVLWSVRGSMGSLPTEHPVTSALVRVASRFSSRPSCVLYNSQLAARQYEERGYDANRTRVIPNGFNCDMFRPDERAHESVRSELGVPKHSSLIGLLARYHPVKDHASFLAAAASLARSGSSAQFVLAGRDVEKTNGHLTSQISDLGLHGRVHLLGERTDIPRITAALDIATLCSVAEAFPNTVGEALSCGIPCVATDVGDCRWIVGETGSIVVPPRDPGALAEAWRSLLKLDPTEYKKIGEAGRHRIVENFSIDMIARQYEDLYTEIIATKGHLASVTAVRRTAGASGKTLSEARDSARPV